MASSAARLAANTANAQHSTGPRTPEGQARSSQNARTHGLTARTVVLSNENQAEYDALLESYIQHLQPTDPVEMDLITDMVNAKWQQRRLNNTEAAMFEEQMEKQKEELAEEYESYTEVFAQAFAFQELSESVALQTLHRTASRLERAYSRALNNLMRFRKLAKSNPAANIQKDEKRIESQERTPATDHESTPMEGQSESNPPAQPSAPSSSKRNSDPAGGT